MPKKILVVDDERDIVEIVCELLQDSGYQTLAAYDGEKALEIVQTDRPDGLVLDLKMPGTDGLTVIKRIRNSTEFSSMPIVVLTATQFLPETREQFKKLQINVWMSKPFEPADLVEAVSKAVGGA